MLTSIYCQWLVKLDATRGNSYNITRHRMLAVEWERNAESDEYTVIKTMVNECENHQLPDKCDSLKYLFHHQKLLFSI